MEGTLLYKSSKFPAIFLNTINITFFATIGYASEFIILAKRIFNTTLLNIILRSPSYNPNDFRLTISGQQLG